MVIIGIWYYRFRQAVSVLSSCAHVFAQEGGGADVEYIIITLVVILLLIEAIKKD